MPVYVYRNLTTGETFELSQRITEPALTEHPETGDPVKRLIQPVGIAFKGSGFYVTDSRKARNGASAGKASGLESKGEAKANDTSEAQSDAKSETKSETKSDAKSETKRNTKSEPTSASTGSASSSAND